MSALKWVFCDSSVLVRKLAVHLATNASLYASSTCAQLRLLASPFDQGFKSVVKYHLLGKVRFKPMQPALCPLTLCDLWGGQQGISKALAFHCNCTVQLADICRSFPQLMLVNLRRFLPSFPSPPPPPTPLVCWFLVCIWSGKLLPLISFRVTALVSGRFLG